MGSCGQICVVKSIEKWKARGWELPFGGEKDNEYVLWV